MKNYFTNPVATNAVACKFKNVHANLPVKKYPSTLAAVRQLLACIGLFTFLLTGNISMAQSSGGGVPTGMSKMNVHLLLNNNGGNMNAIDACMIIYKSNFTIGIGPEDSYKFTNIDENIAINCGSVLLSVMGKPFAIDYDTIPLKIWQYRHTSYVLSLDATNFSPTQAAVLKDNYLQQEYPVSLTGITDVSFSLTADSASSAAGRFCIYLRPAGTLALTMLQLSASAKENGVQVQWTMANEATVDHYEVERSADASAFSKKATVAPANGGLHLWIDKEAPSGISYYRIKTVEKSGNVELSKIVKVMAGTRQQGISIYPNPVTGNKIGLQLQDMEKGVYQLKLYNSSGQPVFNTSVLHSGSTAAQSICVGNYVTKGNYTLVVTNGTNSYNRMVVIN